MIEASSCVICEGEILPLKEALVAPFLAARIWQRPPFCVNLVQCKACGFMFYNPRLDAAEEGRLYAGYRSEEYLRMRHASEPWYTARFNADLASPDSYELRRRTLAAILRQHTAKREIRRVLDYGGDHGDLVRGLVSEAAAFVYDISGVPAVEGVTSTTDPAACKADLVINSNVLEHVGFPRRLVGEILQANSPWRHGLPGSPLRVTVRPHQDLQAAGTARDHGSRTARSRRTGRPYRRSLHDARAHQLLHGAVVVHPDAIRRLRRNRLRHLSRQRPRRKRRHGLVPGYCAWSDRRFRLSTRTH